MVLDKSPVWGGGDVPKFGVYLCHPTSRILGPFIERHGYVPDLLGGFLKFTIIKFKLIICMNYRPENITGNPPAYKLSCNAMVRFCQPSQRAMESMKMTYSEVMILKVYE